MKIDWRANGGNYSSQQCDVSSKAFPSAAVNLPLTNRLIFGSIYVSFSTGIKNSRSLCSTDAIGLYIVSIVSWTVACRDVELWINWQGSRRWHGRAANEACWEMSFLYSSSLLYLAGFFAFFAFPLLCLLPWPLNSFITLWADTATFLDMISGIFALGSVFRAMSLTK